MTFLSWLACAGTVRTDVVTDTTSDASDAETDTVTAPPTDPPTDSPPTDQPPTDLPPPLDRLPTAMAVVTPSTGLAPLTVHLDATGTDWGDGPSVAQWTVGATVVEGVEVDVVVLETTTVTLTVTDADGDISVAETVDVTIEPPVCASYESLPTLLGPLANLELDEASGLRASRVNPGVLWSHNDRNDLPYDGARVFALGMDAQSLGEFWLAGIEAYDFEDMELGPGPDGEDWLWVGDVGDNHFERETIEVHRFREPDVDAGGGDGGIGFIDSGVETLTMTWPGEVLNSEAILLDPQTGELFVISKNIDGLSEVFRYPMPFRPDETVVLESVGPLTVVDTDSKNITGAAISSDGSRVAVRTYTHLLLWERPVGSALGDVFSSEPCVSRLPPQSGGESIAWALDDIDLLTVAEGEGAALLQVPPQP